MISALHHVQLAMPPGGEAAAIAFYAGVLGLCHVDKPAALAGRGGAWFATGGVRVHLGVEQPFRPALKAHPAFEVASLAEFEARLRAAGVDIRPGEDLPGLRRVFVHDPFGNRIEIVEAR
jgi:catechol 2,3-dioxygenase-like lactoylglutathione lyase family enzyme